MRPLSNPRNARRKTRRSFTYTQARAGVALRPRSRRRGLSQEKWLALGLLAAALGLVILFSTSTAFFVYSDETEFAGLRILTPEAVWNAAGIPDGLSVFFLSKDRVEERLSALPVTQEACVTLRFPNRLRISITEREPAAVWSAGSATWWVDQGGHVLSEASVSSDLPVVISDAEGTVEPGSRVSETAVRSAATYHRLLEGATTFRFAPGRGLSLITAEGWPVHLGDDTDCQKKVVILRIITEHFARQGIQPRFLDLRVPEVPSYK